MTIYDAPHEPRVEKSLSSSLVELYHLQKAPLLLPIDLDPLLGGFLGLFPRTPFRATEHQLSE
jgi:hypothetical protein